MAKPSFKKIVKQKDELLNNLFEGLGFGDTNTLGLTPAQHYRRTALQTFLEQDLHHRDLVSIYNEVFEISAVGNEDMIINKLVDFYVAEDKLSKQTKRNIYPVITKIKEMGGNRKKLTKYFTQIRKGNARLLETQWNLAIDAINQEDLYMGIRHVMPESIEMRIIINDMDDYLGLLENLDRPSFDVTPYTRLDWDRIPLRRPKNVKQIEFRPYNPPNNLQELKEMHQRFKEQFSKKAQEYILGENILLKDGAEFQLLNDDYYQYLGWGQASGDQPIMQLNEKMQQLYEKLYGQERGQYFYEKAVEYGFEDANEWFDEVLQETNATDPMTVLWDKTSRDAETIVRDRVKAKVDKFMVRSPFDDRFPDEMEFKLGPVTRDTAAGASIYQVTDNPLADIPDTPPNTTLRVMEETGLSSHSDRIRQVAQDYHKIMGYSDPEFKPAMVFNDEIGAAAADIFEQLPMFDDNAIPYYKKFIQETNMQYQVLLDAGIEFEVVDGDPYTPNRAGHQEMIADMENGRLKVLATESGFGIDDTNTSLLNPMLAESKYTDVNGRVMLENDVFRAVHDTFGHGMRGNTFGPIGEYNAWLAHKEMYSADARRVMTTETLGQNTFTNYGPHMRDADGNLLGKADAGYIKPADRPFASQKVALMPEEIITAAGNVVEDAADLVDKASLNKVEQLAVTQPQVVDGIMNSAKKVVGKTFNTFAGVLDPGDLAITAGIARVLPRLGLAAISGPALAAYVGYELAVLLIDAAQAVDKGRQNQGIDLLDFDNTNPDINWKQLGKDTWSEFGDISDTWSLSWKISEPIIDYAFGEYAKLQENR